MLQKLCAYTDVTSALICGGGRDLRSQEAALRLRPDVVVCTPGRLLDHLRNSRSVSVESLDVLVLDEVDRLLDLGFEEEVGELVRQCPVARQTLLFSATLTSKVRTACTASTLARAFPLTKTFIALGFVFLVFMGVVCRWRTWPGCRCAARCESRRRWRPPLSRRASCRSSCECGSTVSARRCCCR